MRNWTDSTEPSERPVVDLPGLWRDRARLFDLSLRTLLRSLVDEKMLTDDQLESLLQDCLNYTGERVLAKIEENLLRDRD